MEETQNINSYQASVIIDRMTDKIISEWRSRVLTIIPSAHLQTQKELINTFPVFIKKISEVLRPENIRNITFEDIIDISQEHGGQRARLLDYSINEMLREYHLLREVIFSVVESQYTLPNIERDIILSSIELAMSESSSHFVKLTRQEGEVARLVFDSLKDYAIIQTDRRGTIIDWNQGAEKILQYKRDEIVGNNISIIFNEEDLAQGLDKAEMRKALETGKAEDNKWHVRKNGELFFSNGIVTPLRNEQGQLRGYIKILRDETERKEQEEIVARVKQSAVQAEERLRLALTAGEMGTWRFNLSNRTVVRDANLNAILGEEATETCEPLYHFWELLHPDDRDKAMEVFKKSLEENKPYRNEFRIVRPDESIRWLRSTGRVVYGEEINDSFFTGVVVDITERVNADIEVESARQELHDLIMQTPTGIALLEGRDHHYSLINPAYEKLASRNPIGLSIKEAFKEEEAWHYIKLLDDVYKTGTPYIGTELPFNLEDENGNPQELYLNVGLHPFRRSDNSIKGILAFVQDVTDQVKAKKILEENEERFRELANGLPVIIWTARADFFVDWYNDWWYKYLGLPRGTTWDDEGTMPMHPDDIPMTKKRIKKCLETGKDFLIEQRFKRGVDGQYRWHLVQAVPIKDEQGKIIKWVGANTDIHDHKMLVRKLEDEQDIRERFVSTLSHDLRTPLTAAKMSTQLLIRKLNDLPSLLKTAHRVVTNLERADRMIKDLLDVSFISGGQELPLKLEDTDLVKLIREAIEELSLLHGDRFIIEGPDRVEGLWDPEAIKRIVENLLGNAIKYGDTVKPILLLVESLESNVLIKVHNEGNPISLKDQQTLFEKYRRADSAKSGGQKGWGLGLSLVKGLTESHHGKVSVESSAEKGTTFTVLLPKNPLKQ